MIRNWLHAWRTRGMDNAIRRIGEVALNEPRRQFSCVELRDRTGLRFGPAQQALDSLVDCEWLQVRAMNFGNRYMNVYQVTPRGMLCFASLLRTNDANGDDDSNSGDTAGRQVWGDALRVERVDEYHVALVPEDGESVILPNNEWAKMRREIQNGEWDDINGSGSVPRIRT